MKKRRKSPDDMKYFSRFTNTSSHHYKSGAVEPVMRSRKESRHASCEKGMRHLGDYPSDFPWNSPERKGIIGVYNSSLSPIRGRDLSPMGKSDNSNRSMSNLSSLQIKNAMNRRMKRPSLVLDEEKMARIVVNYLRMKKNIIGDDYDSKLFNS